MITDSRHGRRRTMWGTALGLGLGLAVGGTTLRAAETGAPVFNLQLKAETHEIEVLYRGHRLMTYVFQSNPFKPYVRELCSVEGFNVLRDAPSDHLHHHGAMYAIKVNGTNFWEESKLGGYQRSGPEVSRRVSRDLEGRPQAQIAHRVYWTPAREATDLEAAAFLVEDRELTLTVDESTREVALEWRSSFKVGGAAPQVTLTGSSYHGLGVRFIEPFDHTARRQNSAGAPYLPAGTDEVTAAVWGSTSQTIDGRAYTVTLFDDPGNAAEPKFFSMLNGFNYLSATQGLDVSPLVYRAGDVFRLRYLLTVHSGERSAAELNRRHQQWLR